MEEQPCQCDVDHVVDDEKHAKAQEFKNTGNEKFNKNNYKGAIVEYQKGLLHEPNNPELHANLSAAYLRLEKYIEAEEHAIFAIHLRPNFYKGYMRAAKADHGKGMTRLALKRLSQGLANVTDSNGLKELNRLKNQYTAYLSLQSNSEHEMEFDSDTYQSEDEEDEGLSTDEDSGDEPPLPINEPEAPPPIALPAQLVSPAPLPVPTLAENPSETIIDPPIAKSSSDSQDEQTEPTKEENTVAPVELNEAKLSAYQEKTSQLSGFVATDITDKDEIKQISEKWENFLKTYIPNLTKDTPSSNLEDKPKHPLAALRELSRSSELKKSIADFKENLKAGGEAYLSGNYRKAADNYKAAYERIGQRYFDFETEERECNVIRYASFAAMINLNTYDDIVKSIHGLNEMTKFAYDFPAIYFQIARAYCKLNRFKTALESLEKVQAIIDNLPIFPTFIWPGTNEIIEQTTPSGLKNSIKELNQLCRMSHKPTAVCRYKDCLKTTSHVVPSELIYSTDPDFIGYVRIICEEKCHIEFHIPCWKSYKESVCGIGKVNDKDFLSRPCLTTDCINSEGTDCSIITSIEIIGSDGQVKSVNKLDPKANSEQKAAEKKAKKKRSKLDDKENKEKVVKPKKTRERKFKIKEKKHTHGMQEDGNEDEDFESATNDNVIVDPVKVMQTRKESLLELRLCNFGVDKKSEMDIQKRFYGNSDEVIKAAAGLFMDHSNDSQESMDVKNYFFSYFLDILKDEEPLKLTDVDDHWKEQGGENSDVKTVLPNTTSVTGVSDILLESNRFCQLEDHLCLADQLDEGFKTVKEDVVDYISTLMSRVGTFDTDSQQTDSIKDHEDGGSFSGEESDENSSDSDKFDYDGSDDEDNAENNYIPPVAGEHIKQLNDERSLEDLLKDMTKWKNQLLPKGEEDSYPLTSENEISKEQPEETNCNETFETAYDSSPNTTSENVKMSPSTDKECVYLETSAVPSIAHHKVDPPQALADELTKSTKPPLQSTRLPVNQEVFESTECDKGSQSEIVTEERHIQTAPTETKDRLSQTKESDLYKELNKKVQELTSKLSLVNKELVLEKQIVKAQHATIAKLHEDGKRSIDALHEQMKADLLKKENEYKKKEDELIKKVNCMKDMYSSQLQEWDKLKQDMGVLLKEKAEADHSTSAALANVKEIEKKCKLQEFNAKGRLQKALKAQLLIIKACWGAQLNLHKKRCVERITEIQSWFNTVGCFGDVLTLPSYPLVHQNIEQWTKTAKQLQKIESDFQEKYSTIERNIEQGNDLDDLKPDILPTMPKEPSIPPLDKIHKEITEKHMKAISELTQLVASQQLQIEKIKEQADQLKQLLMSTFQNNQMASPRLPQPITASFGGLSLQYPFPGTVPTQYPGPSNVLPTSQDTSMMGNSSKLADVHTLLQESSKMLSSPSSSLFYSPLKDEAVSQTPPTGAYNYPPPFVHPPLQPSAGVPGPILSMPPPPIGVAQSLFKNGSLTAEPKKESNPSEQRASTPKTDQKVESSRESTSGPTSTPAPTPEKTKKKKKTKSGEAAAAEARLSAAKLVAAPSMETTTAMLETVFSLEPDTARDDSSGWNVVLPKSAIPKHSAQPSASMTEVKMKNKKKLMDKLQARFPTIPIKDIDDIVKQVRELNNGSLSGLPYDEIEARVERVITKRHIQKNSTMGLVKFSEAAWGTVKPQEIKSWSNLQLEECTICLEPMGDERTKVDCNHEFHTKCLRKWLKEKSVCPLCNKFTTMPDEFPAL